MRKAVISIVSCTLGAGLTWALTEAPRETKTWPECAVTWASGVCGTRETRTKCKACCDKHCEGADVAQCKAVCDVTEFR